MPPPGLLHAPVTTFFFSFFAIYLHFFYIKLAPWMPPRGNARGRRTVRTPLCTPLVDLTSFVRRVAGSPRRDLGQLLRSQLPVALRRETQTQYPCCVGSASEYSSGLKDA